MTGEFGEVVIFQAEDGCTSLDVHLQNETVWLSQAQLVELFNRDQSVVSRHIRNVFKEGELDEKSNMQKVHIAHSDKPVRFYNLDVIISVGYRVKSLQGTQFRIWATSVLKDHLIKGYSLNERRLAEKGLLEMEQAVSLLANTLRRNELITAQGSAVLDHLFVDGNKRIGSFLFLLFLQEHGMLERACINQNGLVALTLLVAESDAGQKELMIRLILNLLNNS
jgi:hypothetical protein